MLKWLKKVRSYLKDRKSNTYKSQIEKDWKKGNFEEVLNMTSNIKADISNRKENILIAQQEN